MKTLLSKFRTASFFAFFIWPFVLGAQTPQSALPIPTQTPPSSAASASASHDPYHPRTSLVFVMRHAIAPGTGDPPGFRLGDCSTQRNLSKDGIRQAEKIGKDLKSIGIQPTSIWSSQWCRAFDTATNMGLGPVTPLPALNSFFTRQQHEPEQMRQLEHFLANLDPAKGPYVLVTHQVVITSLTGVFPGSGEGVWLRLTGDKNKPWVIQPLANF